MTFIEYAIAHDLTLRAVVAAFCKGELPKEVGAPDREKDRTVVHWMIRQGCTAASWLDQRVLRYWPQRRWGPRLPRGPLVLRKAFLWPAAPRRCWWGDGEGLSLLRFQSDALTAQVEYLSAERKKVEEQVDYATRGLRARLANLDAHLKILDIRQSHHRQLLADLEEAAATGRTIIANAQDLATLRRTLFPEDFVREEVAREMRRARDRAATRRALETAQVADAHP